MMYSCNQGYNLMCSGNTSLVRSSSPETVFFSDRYHAILRLRYKTNFLNIEKELLVKTLGQVPPRITGIKMHDQNISRKEMIMDMDIVFASNLVVEFKVKKGKNCRISP